MADILAQTEYDIRCEWGLRGVQALAPISDAVVLVDVLSFTTCVDIATENGAVILPYQFKDDTVSAYARSRNAIAASSRRDSGPSLSPASLLDIPAGTRLVLPSPNGATLSLAVGNAPTLAGCLRNASAVAAFASKVAITVAVVPCGERWPDGSLRPALEDWLGAGAIISRLSGAKSPEAQAAQNLFETHRHALAPVLAACSSGKELIARSFSRDVACAAKLDCSRAVPLLEEGAYVNSSP